VRCQRHYLPNDVATIKGTKTKISHC